MAEIHVKWVERPHFEYRGAIQVDNWGVKKYHLKIGIMSALLVIGYAYVFSWFMTALSNACQFLILLSFNLLFGMVGARAYHLAGEIGGDTLHFLAPRSKNNGANLRMEKSNMNEIHAIFEKANHHISSLASVERDDYRDVAWFFVISYSVLSLLMGTALGINFWMIPANSVVFGAIFGLVYVNSYLTYPRTKLIEGLTALEYCVTATVEKMNKIEAPVNGCPVITWVQQNDDWLIYDFGYSFEAETEKSLMGFYHLGLAFDADESFELECSDDSALADYHLSNGMRHAGWNLEISVSEGQQRGYMWRNRDYFNLKQPWRINVDPEWIGQDRSSLAATMQEIFSNCKSG